ncbi:MAG: TonB-dependent receptor [Ignavibacteriales bacterium]|nr:TonB-dependent receptor [Ignavibacteriales bacterium]
MKFSEFKSLIILLTLSPFIQLHTQTKTDTLNHELNQITVSATRSPELILEIPYAVSILGVKDLQNFKGIGIDEALSKVPGVLAQSRAGSQDVRIVIRGFGARGAGDRSNSGTSRGIRIMIDGIPETEPDGRTSFDNIDLSLAENIEVVRSNASALWGNAAGGIIDISYNKQFVNPYLDVNGIFGSYGFQKYSFQTGTKIGNGKIQFGFTNSNFDGWRDHSSGDRSIINLGISSQLEENTLLNISVLGSNSLFHIPGPLTLDEFNSDASQANSVYKSRDERRHNRLGKIGFTLTHQIDNSNTISGMLYANPKYLQRSERGTFRDFTRYHFGGNLIYKNETNFNDDLKNMLTVGMDEAYQDGAILFYSLSATNNRGDELRNNKREGANSFGTFLQNEIRFGERLSVIFGGRYDNITYYSEDFLAPEFGLQEKSFDRFTPKFGVSYMFSNTQSVYANLGGGVEVPAGNETDPAGTFGQDTVYLLSPLLEPIKSSTIELGTKNILYFGQNKLLQYLTYDAALYYINITNDIIPYRGGRFYFTAGKSHRTGIELNTNFNFNYGLSLQGNFTYSLNKYDEYLVDSVHYNNPGKFADYADNKVAGIPDLFYNITAAYAPNNLYGLFISFNVSGVGKYFADDANTLEVPSYLTLSATLGLNKTIEITKWLNVRGFITVNNITDKLYASSAFINPDYLNGKPVYLEAGLPRNVIASLQIGI